MVKMLFRLLNELFYRNGEHLPRLLAALRAWAWQRTCGPDPLEARKGQADDWALREQLAAYAHKAWSGWMKYQFDQGTFNADGSWTMPAWAVARRSRQMNIDYWDLPADEQELDREEADSILVIVGRGTLAGSI